MNRLLKGMILLLMAFSLNVGGMEKEKAAQNSDKQAQNNTCEQKVEFPLLPNNTHACLNSYRWKDQLNLLERKWEFDEVGRSLSSTKRDSL